MYSEEMCGVDGSKVQQMMDRLQAGLERQKKQLAEQEQEIEELKKLLENSHTGMNQNAGVQSCSCRDALSAVYEVISSLEKHTTEEVLFYAAQILAEVMDCRNVAIYMVANRDYARLFSSTSPEAGKLGNSIKYTAMEEIYTELKNGRIYINKEMDANLPSMASAVYAEEDIRVILMFWEMPFQRVNAEEAKRLTVVETLLQNAILRASRYMAEFRKHRYLEGTNVLNEKAFTTLVKTFFDAREKGLTECTLLEVMIGYQDYEDVSIQIACNIRQSDYMGLLEDKKLYILLSNTDSKNAEVVQERLQKLGYRSVLSDIPVHNITE